MNGLIPIEQSIRRELIRQVQEGNFDNTFVYYGILARQFNQPYVNGNIADRNRFHTILGHISEYEVEHERPMLSVIVVAQETRMPGHGFFTLARKLRRQRPDEDEDAFALRERRAVFEFWEHNEYVD